MGLDIHFAFSLKAKLLLPQMVNAIRSAPGVCCAVVVAVPSRRLIYDVVYLQGNVAWTHLRRGLFARQCGMDLGNPHCGD
jgi:hypothetical protein